MAHYSKEPYFMSGGTSGSGGGGMRVITGEGAPDASTGQPGDIYIDTVGGDLYSNKNGTWANELNLKGPKGDDGAQGVQGQQGAPGATGAKGEQGTPGADGFPSEEDWNALVARVAAIEGGE